MWTVSDQSTGFAWKDSVYQTLTAAQHAETSNIQKFILISSAEASPARTSPSPADAQDSQEPLRPLPRVRPHR